MINSSNYVEHALKTEAQVTQEMINRISDPRMIRLLHGTIGLATEVGELLDAIKKHIYYGKPLDLINIAEENGDLYWYQALIIDVLRTTIDEVMTVNIAKLQARYPDKFTEYNAEHRDLETERAILEGKECGTCDAQGMCGI